MATKPNILIFGGLDLLVAALASQLIPPAPAEPLISHLRVVDKYSINPPTKFFPNSLLKLPAAVSKAYTDVTPNGLPYDYVIDSTAELVPDRPVELYIRNMFDVALNIARASAEQLSRTPGSIKAHIRLVCPFYEHKKDKKRYAEADPEGWKVKDMRGVWGHEALRAIASIEGLPLVALRTGLVYGNGFYQYEAVGLILLGLVYKHLGRDMTLLWSPDLPKNLINICDFAGVVWKAAEWMSTKTRNEANTLAGVPIPPSGDPSVTKENAPNVLLPSSGSVTVPLFNMVDESDATQRSLSEVVGRVFGVKVKFQGLIKGLFAGMKLKEVTEEANQAHMEAWNEIIMNSKPPVPSTPLSPYMPLSLVEEHGVAMQADRLKSILGYEFQYPRFDDRAVRDYIDWCRSEGIWPDIDTPTSS